MKHPIIMNRLEFPKFNIELTLNGGQAFNWSKIDDYYIGVFSDFIIKVKYIDSVLYWQTYPEKDNFELIQKVFRVNYDYESMLEKISKDKYIIAAIKKYEGLRLLQQEFDQTLISFIVSQNSNIPKIKRSLNKLSEKFGKEIIVDNHKFYLFPKLEDLKDLKELDFAESGVGYRAKYLEKVIKEVLEKNLSQKVYKMSYEEAKSELLKLHGIGDKVADCILVFSLSHDRITPLDLWARRAFTQTYNLEEKMSYKDLQEFIGNYFGDYTAWAGQFLFEYFRLKEKSS